MQPLFDAPDQDKLLHDRLPASYCAFLETFNAGRYHEAHDVLEVLWLQERGRSDADFYQALIQVAGAFVHVQKRRWQPADRLLQRADARLTPYGEWHLGLPVTQLRNSIALWRLDLKRDPATLAAQICTTPPGVRMPALTAGLRV